MEKSRKLRKQTRRIKDLTWIDEYGTALRIKEGYSPIDAATPSTVDLTIGKTGAPVLTSIVLDDTDIRRIDAWTQNAEPPSLHISAAGGSLAEQQHWHPHDIALRPAFRRITLDEVERIAV
jgi:hypothetical protein